MGLEEASLKPSEHTQCSIVYNKETIDKPHGLPCIVYFMMFSLKRGDIKLPEAFYALRTWGLASFLALLWSPRPPHEAAKRKKGGVIKTRL